MRILSLIALIALGLLLPVPSHAQTSSSNRFDEEALIALADEAIEATKARYLHTDQHTAWQILHGLLALRNDYQLKTSTGTVSAIEYISGGPTLNGKHWFQATQWGGRAHPYSGVMYEFEGHINQSMALIAMSNLPVTHQFIAEGNKPLTMQDMINHAKMAATTREEITWTLWFLTHYIDPESEWVNGTGEQWSMERLVRMQTNASVHNAPCGGTHGLFALAYARNAYLQKHGRLQGEWLRADQKIQQYISAARSMQNRDGSFSTGYFKSRGYSRDFNERLRTSGHMLEWLMMALPKRRLEEQWVKNAVYSLARDLANNSSLPAECGGLYHACHAIVLYRQRVAPDHTPQPQEQLAQIPPKTGPVISTGPDDSAEPKMQPAEEPKLHIAETKPLVLPKPEATLKPEPSPKTEVASKPVMEPPTLSVKPPVIVQDLTTPPRIMEPTGAKPLDPVAPAIPRRTAEANTSTPEVYKKTVEVPADPAPAQGKWKSTRNLKVIEEEPLPHPPAEVAPVEEVIPDPPADIIAPVLLPITSETVITQPPAPRLPENVEPIPEGLLPFLTPVILEANIETQTSK